MSESHSTTQRRKWDASKRKRSRLPATARLSPCSTTSLPPVLRWTNSIRRRPVRYAVHGRSITVSITACGYTAPRDVVGCTNIRTIGIHGVLRPGCSVSNAMQWSHPFKYPGLKPGSLRTLMSGHIDRVASKLNLVRVDSAATAESCCTSAMTAAIRLSSQRYAP